MAAVEEQDVQGEPRGEGVGDASAPGSGEAPSAAHRAAIRHVWKQEGQGLSLGLGWVSLAAWVHPTALGTGRGWNAGKSSGRCPAPSPTLAAGAEEGFLLLQHCSRRCLLPYHSLQ